MLKSTFKKIIENASLSELVELVEWCSLSRDHSPSSVRFAQKLAVKNKFTIDCCIEEIRKRNAKNIRKNSGVAVCA